MYLLRYVDFIVIKKVWYMLGLRSGFLGSNFCKLMVFIDNDMFDVI